MRAYETPLAAQLLARHDPIPGQAQQQSLRDAEHFRGAVGVEDSLSVGEDMGSVAEGYAHDKARLSEDQVVLQALGNALLARMSFRSAAG